MKKNRMMRTASGLLVATLLTTSIISGTFAKYTTSDSATDTARVAKFGALVTVSGSLFADSYKDVPETTDATVVAYNRSTTTGDVHDGDDIVAPGTKNDAGITFGLSGKPEVSTKITYTVDKTKEAEYSNIWLADGEYGVMVAAQDTVGEKLKDCYTRNENAGVVTYTKVVDDTIGVDGTTYYKYEKIVKLDETEYASADNRYSTGDKKYYPIVWKCTIGEAETIAYSFDNLDNAITAINGTANFTYAPNTDLGTAVTNSDVKVAWEWPFEVKDGTTNAVNAIVDGCDTVLGNLIAETEVVKMGASNAVKVITVETTNGVTKAKAGSDDVACLTAAYNVKVTLEQVD